MSQTYAIIMCGGSGTRLWPRSRSKHPKHLLKLNGARTLVQETVARIKLPLSHIYCVTEASHAELLKAQLPELPSDNVIVEPGRRGTASAIGLAIATMRDRVKPGDVVVSSHADSLIQDREAFHQTMQAWVKAAITTKRIINLGVRPTYPSTALGYINLGRRIYKTGAFDVFETKQFVEKPDESTAQTYLESGRYLWNTGMFAAKFGVIDKEMRTHMPGLMEQLDAVADALRAHKPKAATRLYLQLTEETIDYGLLEKSANLAVIPASFSWADIGSWADLHDMLERDSQGNMFEGEYVDIDSKNCLIYSPNQLVATVGLENLVIINTKDAVLICPKDRSQDVKKIVEKLKTRGKTEYL